MDRSSKRTPILLASALLVTSPYVLAGEARTASTPASSPTPASLVFADVDGDGLDDAFVVGADGQARLLMNFGQGRFEDITLAANLGELGGATCALFADFDGDGRPDLFTGSSEHRLWRNLGNATFEPLESGIDHDLVDLAAQAVDHDHDGRLDLQIHTEAGDLVYRNTGAGHFERLDLPLVELPKELTLVGWAAPVAVDPADPQATPDAGKPTQRRLERWIRGRAAGSSSSPTAGSASGTSAMGPTQPALATCLPGIRDTSGGGCIGASSVPELGKLYPMSATLNVTPDGNVGIGTTMPTQKLDVAGNAIVSGHLGIGTSSPGRPLQVEGDLYGLAQHSPTFGSDVTTYCDSTGGWIGTVGDYPLYFFTHDSTPMMTLTQSGDLGIVGNATASGGITGNTLVSTVATGTAPIAVTSTTKVTNLNADSLDGLDANAFSQLGNSIESAEITDGTITSADLANNSVNAAKIADGSLTGADISTTSGNVGVGTTTPNARLDISNIGGLNGTHMLGFGEGAAAEFFFDSRFLPSGGSNAVTFSSTVAGARDIMTWEGSGRVAVGTTTIDPRYKFQVEQTGYGIAQTDATNGVRLSTYTNGAGAWIGTVSDHHFYIYVNDGGPSLTVYKTGNVSIKNALEIRGGADIVEHFESSCGNLEPGTVVAIDPEHPGQLACASGAYDTKVAGVVSGAGGIQPGLCLSQEGVLEGETPIAMNGRVYVKCTAANGAIKPGDRLTTSDRAGHAMRVSDEQRSIGAVIGKAMTSLESGEGLVLVLVNLQ